MRAQKFSCFRSALQTSWRDWVWTAYTTLSSIGWTEKPAKQTAKRKLESKRVRTIIFMETTNITHTCCVDPEKVERTLAVKDDTHRVPTASPIRTTLTLNRSNACYASQFHRNKREVSFSKRTIPRGLTRVGLAQV